MRHSVPLMCLGFALFSAVSLAAAQQATPQPQTQARTTEDQATMACTIASVIGRPCRQVVDVYERDHGQGWGNIAKQMGIKPGSPEFHRLKNGFVPAYDRWGRPIVLDADLKKVYPNHGKSKSLEHGNSGKGNSGKGNSGKGNSGKGQGNSGKGNGHH